MGSISKITRNTRLSFRQKLKNHEKLKSSASSINKGYSSLIGPLHALPDYLIIGAAKCGTSSLYEYLIQHPNVEPAIGKEINFFDMRYDRGINWYRTYFPSLIQRSFSKSIFKNNLITGEATPRYIDHPHAPERVKNLLPNVKLIVMLRNPVDRAYSHWNMMVAHKREELSFEDAMDKEKERISGLFEKMSADQKFYSREYYWYAYLERSIYIDKLKRWFKYFPREQFLFLKSEEFFKDPNTAYAKALSFLGLEEFELEDYKTVRKGSYKKSKMESSTRTKLLEFFKPKNEELYKFLGIDFEWD